MKSMDDEDGYIYAFEIRGVSVQSYMLLCD